ncbi:hypothetical protein ACFORH_28265 [Amycolatopsis roodepoortensis]|uniref:Secreted protein n=1 Tax=Amycolatopsis roodepoortensis TaxID=700274 RepID=A0ABR9LHF6_9PSEU|nr:hypothetical protein [Amycolatopsis roodepoortensis]MBE1580114.1 hypothetical protein [Amycolatopsis roodepoortensis]
MKNTLRRFAVAGAAVAAFASISAVTAGAAQASDYEYFKTYPNQEECGISGHHGQIAGDWDGWMCYPSNVIPWAYDLYVQPNF